MNINKLIKDFFNKSLSEANTNSHYSNDEVMSYLVAISLNNDSLESATGISPDTIQRRLNLGQGYDMPWLAHFNKTMYNLIPLIITQNRRMRWSIVIDDSLEPYYGLVNKLKDELNDDCMPDFLTNYQVQRGSTGSFQYFTVCLYSKMGTFPVCILPKVCNADLVPVYEDLLRKIRRTAPNAILLADRGFGNKEMIGLCQKLKLDYCIRLKKAGKLKTIKKEGRYFFWHQFEDIKFRVVMHKSHGRQTFFFAVGKKDGASYWFRLLYKDRWSIENLFKNADRVQIKTNSRSPLFRLFCFTLSIFLMLLYQFKKIISKRARISIRRALYEVFSIKFLVILKVT